VKDALQRLNEREQALFRKREASPGRNNRTTMKTISNKRKHEIIEDYKNKFASKYRPANNKTGFSFKKIIVSLINLIIVRNLMTFYLKNGGELEKMNFLSMKILIIDYGRQENILQNNELLSIQDHVECELPKDKFKDNRNFTKIEKVLPKKITQIINFPGFKSSLGLDTNISNGKFEMFNSLKEQEQKDPTQEGKF